MSQCHDTFNQIEAPGLNGLGNGATALGGAQCHDSYEASTSVLTDASTSVPTDVEHGCRFVGEKRDGVRLIGVIGRLDWVSAGGFRTFMTKATGPDLVIDLSSATTDSAGTGAVLCCVERAHERNQRVVIVAPGPLLYEVLVTTGLGTVAPIVRSRPEATDWFAQHVVAHSSAG